MLALILIGGAGVPLRAASAQSPATQDIIVTATPLPGTGIDSNRLPQTTHVIDNVSRDGAADVLRTLDEETGGVTLDQASGNPNQPGLLYHGFEASPLQGTAQGLAVYLDGVRFNQPFGDTVNWDMLPDVAVEQINLESANPVFGLNALGGALAVRLKNGFTDQGGGIVLSGGSFGQAQAQLRYGRQLGAFSIFAAGSVLHEDGWRDLQSSDIHDGYLDIGWRNGKTEIQLGIIAADTTLNGPGTSPVQLLDVDPRLSFTNPNAIDDSFLQMELTASHRLNDMISMQANGYYDYFLQRVTNGNASDAAPCSSGSGRMCTGGDTILTTRGGAAIPDFLHGGAYSELDDQTTSTNGYGASLQASDEGGLPGRRNHLVAGLSFDGARTAFGATSYLGGLTPLDRVYAGPGIVIDQAGFNEPVRLAVSDAYAGAFVTDTLELTRRLSVTASGRFNLALIDLSDRGGGALSGRHGYDRFNPAIGIAYRLFSSVTAYGGYSESNRAPTPAELSCAGPTASCSLANFFVGDPDLKQVVARGVQLGVRGRIAHSKSAGLSYDFSLFDSQLDDDILFVNSPVRGRAYFKNVGRTRRRGADVTLTLITQRWRATIGYSYTEASFRTGFTEASADNPAADANGDIMIRRGDRLPGVPASLLKATAHFMLTSSWSIGGTGIASGGTYLYGDEANLTPRLPAYWVLNLESRYQVTPALRIFAHVDNVTDRRYYTYGTFSPTSAVTLAQAPNAANPRSYSPSAPIGGIGGMALSF